MLLVLQLIMALQDTLGPQVFSKPTQIIAFACNIIQGYADRMTAFKERKESKPEKSGRIDIANIVCEQDRAILENDTATQDIEEEFESVMMAINLLRAVMHGTVYNTGNLSELLTCNFLISRQRGSGYSSKPTARKRYCTAENY